jgi:hypothetical protein
MLASNSAYSILLASILASDLEGVQQKLCDLVGEDIAKLNELVCGFLIQPISPESFLQFETQSRETLCEIGRKIMEFACNQCEPQSAEDTPHDVTYQGGGYRRMNHKTPNRCIDTTFGRITLWRRGYRYWHRGVSEPTIFPIELILGIVEGATPALAGEISRMMSEGGATQRRVLEQAKRQFGVSMSVERLRRLATGVSEAMERFRQQYQVRKLLDLLSQAQRSRGRYKPVLSVGRDGISMPLHHGGGFQQGAVGTVAVYDRRGNRLGTIYVAFTPESEQPTLTARLTGLIRECLDKWCNEQGNPLPRLCYVTDAGDNECRYYARALSRMRDPRNSRKYLHWYRIVDYFHASERITTIAEAIFGTDSREGRAWARKARKMLLKPSGVSRVLHSVGALISIHGIKTNHEKALRRACNYLRSRSRHMRYAEFKRLRLPIGSGVTEAACKTVFTQRLKLSGMGWEHAGAQVILDLRVVQLSGIWDEVYAEVVKSNNPIDLRPYNKDNVLAEAIAA